MDKIKGISAIRKSIVLLQAIRNQLNQKKYTILLLFLFALSQSAFTQVTNPFEIRKNESHSEKVKKDTQVIDQSNPFEIIPVPADYEIQDTLIVKKPVPIETNLSKNQNFLFVTLVILLLMLTILVTFNRGLLGSIYRAIFNDTYLKMIYRLQQSSHALSYLLLYLFYFFNAGLFLFLLLRYLKVNITPSDIKLYFLCVGAFVSIYALKHIALVIIGNIFPVEKESSYYNFMIVAFNIFMGLILLPLNAVIAFMSEDLAVLAIYIGVGLFILMYLIRQLRAMLLAGNFISYQKFHFFIYLCTVEIAPILVITRLILNSHNLH